MPADKSLPDDLLRIADDLGNGLGRDRATLRLAAQALRWVPFSAAERDVLAERDKQRAKWGDGHDDEHDTGKLRCVADDLLRSIEWPDARDARDDWGLAEKHPSERDRLVIAAALVLAEIERIDRATEPPQ